MQVKVALRNALRNPRRTLVTMVTVAAGAGALFMFQGFNEGVTAGSRDHTVHAKYGHGHVTTRGYRDQIHEKPWERWIDDAAATATTLRGTPGIADVFPRVEFSALLSNGSVTVGGHGIGVEGAREETFFHQLRLVQGRRLGGTADGIAIGRGLARALGVSPGDRVMVLGNTVRGSVNGLDAVVTGIIETGLKEIDDALFQVQLPLAQELLDTPRVEYFAVSLAREDGWDAAQASIEQRFPALEARSFEVLDKVWYKHTVDWLAEQFRMIRMIILTIVLLGIFNSASSTILERTRELGSLRANGESAFDVLRLLAWEGAAIAGVGALLGLAVVVLINVTLLSRGVVMPPPPGYTETVPVFPVLSPAVALTAFGLTSVAAVVATLLAGIKVVRLPIATALRTL